MNRTLEFLARNAALLLAVGLAGLTELIFTVEWSFPTCGMPGYEAESAVYGFPFPYLQWGRVSSLEYVFVPPLYFANLAARTFVFFFVARLAIRKCLPDREGRASVAGVGLLLCIVFSMAQMALVWMGVRNPTSTLVRESWSSYSELRPVGLGTELEYDCSAMNPEP